MGGIKCSVKTGLLDLIISLLAALLIPGFLNIRVTRCKCLRVCLFCISCVNFFRLNLYSNVCLESTKGRCSRLSGPLCSSRF